MTKKTKTIVWVSLAVAALIVGSASYEKQHPRPPKPSKLAAAAKKDNPAEQATMNPVLATTTPDVTVSTSTVTSTLPSRPVYRPKPKAPPVPSYGDMVTKFEGFRFQFNDNCQAYPNQMATKNPVTLMLDNRSNTWQTIFVGTHNYGVAPYNYVIATINETNLPMNVYISCNQQRNTAMIILQR